MVATKKNEPAETRVIKNNKINRNAFNFYIYVVQFKYFSKS